MQPALPFVVVLQFLSYRRYAFRFAAKLKRKLEVKVNLLLAEASYEQSTQ